MGCCLLSIQLHTSKNAKFRIKKLKIKIRHSLHLLLNLHGIRLFVLCFLFQQKYVVVAAAMTTIITATTPITITFVCDSLSFEESDPCLPPVGACGDGAQSLSGRGAQYCLDSVKPCSLHSGTSSSWLSKQQWEHFWQLWVPSFLLK